MDGHQLVAVQHEVGGVDFDPGRLTSRDTAYDEPDGRGDEQTDMSEAIFAAFHWP